MASLPEQDLDHVLEHTGDCWKALAGARLFITGGSGFVGRWLLESALWANDRLRLNLSIVALTRDPEKFRSKSLHLTDHPAIRLLRGDAQSFDFPDGEFPFVIHASTERYFEPDATRPLSTFDLDVAATRRVLEFARTRGTQRFLFTSSGAVYGKQPPEMTHIPGDYAGAPMPTDSASVYGHAKRISELMCTMYARQYGFAALIARLFAFVGPYLPLDENFAVGNFIGDVLAGRTIQVKGDGTPYRSYLYAADLAVWLWTILLRGKSSYPYNVGSEEAMTIMELARIVTNVTEVGTPIEVAQSPIPGKIPLRYVPSVERASRELGLRSWIAAREGVKRTFDWAAGSSLGAAGALLKPQALPK